MNRFRRRVPHPRRFGGERLDVILVLLLTGGAGMVDAAAFLGLGNVFAGNMTGNVLILGMGTAGGAGMPVAGPIAAFLGFLAGATAAGAFLRRYSGRWAREILACLGFGAVLLLVCALLVALGDPARHRIGVTTAAIAACAMGIQAAAARKLDVTDLTTVVVTVTLTKFAAELGTRGGWAALANRRSAAVVCIALGAAVGALLERCGLGWVFAAAAVVMVGAAVVGGASISTPAGGSRSALRGRGGAG
ncbi:YoaK family protein [Nocardia sp. NPDC088792]|uniref:YoaK family protein n=1 Tax=Nocardia sp. NPDC088792 TaxID=3364332 RepID=UPI0038080D63